MAEMIDLTPFLEAEPESILGAIVREALIHGEIGTVSVAADALIDAHWKNRVVVLNGESIRVVWWSREDNADGEMTFRFKWERP